MSKHILGPDHVRVSVSTGYSVVCAVNWGLGLVSSVRRSAGRAAQESPIDG